MAPRPFIDRWTASFEGMPSADLDRMLEHARPLRVLKDKAVFEQEEEAHSFFLLLDGHVRVVKTTADGQQIIVRYISPGELMGIGQALGRRTYPASAIAVVDCVVLAWPGHLWPEFAASFPTFGANTFKTAGTRLQETQARVVELSTEQVRHRRASHHCGSATPRTGRAARGAATRQASHPA